MCSLYDSLTETITENQLIKDSVFSNETLTSFQAERIDFDHVHFEKCRFIQCDFSHASFLHVRMDSCDFSNCTFADSYWKECEIHACKANGAVFEHATLRNVSIIDTPCKYMNLSQALLDHCRITDCDLQDSALSQMKLKQTIFDNVDFRHSDFFKTPLKGVDMSSCRIEGILISDTFSELRGMKIDASQAPYIASCLGVKIK